MRLMPKTVSIKEEWRVYSVSWLKKWEHYTYFDLIEQTKPSNEEARPFPGPIDCSDILVEPDKLQLFEGSKASLLSSRALKPNLSEGSDFMLVDDKVHQLFAKKYN